MKLLLALVALGAATAAQFGDISEDKFEVFSPRLIAQKFENPLDKYASHVQVQIEFDGASLFLELTVDKELFAPGWALETTDENGVVSVKTDVSEFMCHFRGVVKNVNNSSVTMSLCDQLGMRGTVSTPDLDIEIRHHVPLALTWKRGSFRSFYDEAHVVYRVSDLETVASSDEPVSSDYPEILSDPVVGDDPSVLNSRAGAVIISDSRRMRAFNSGGAETQNTQSLLAQANRRYSATSWRGGSLSISIARQVQNPSGWTYSGNVGTYLANLARFKGSSYASADVVVGLGSQNGGYVNGVAYGTTMCQSSRSAGVNILGTRGSDASSGVLIAHEMGHNFGFVHDSGANSFVMWPTINGGMTRFSPTSIARFAVTRSGFRCL